MNHRDAEDSDDLKFAQRRASLVLRRGYNRWVNDEIYSFCPQKVDARTRGYKSSPREDNLVQSIVLSIQRCRSDTYDPRTGTLSLYLRKMLVSFRLAISDGRTTQRSCSEREFRNFVEIGLRRGEHTQAFCLISFLSDRRNCP